MAGQLLNPIPVKLHNGVSENTISQKRRDIDDTAQLKLMEEDRNTGVAAITSTGYFVGVYHVTVLSYSAVTISYVFIMSR